jgi:hypothetical protein
LLEPRCSKNKLLYIFVNLWFVFENALTNIPRTLRHMQFQPGVNT